MKPQVKERIVGAAVLVALGVWLIPLVLDGPGDDAPASPPVAALDLSNGEAELPIRTETVELAPRSAGAEPAADQGAAPAADEGAAPAEPADDDSAAAETASARAGEAGGGDAPTAELPRPGGAAASSPIPETEPPVAVAAPGQPATGWGVQIGAFSELANARQQASRVRDLGYDAEVTPVETGGRTLYRVRVGGFATETQAEVASGALAAHDFRGDVYGPE